MTTLATRIRSVVVGIVLVSITLVGANAANGGTPGTVITVTPNSGLTPVQSVTISGTGFNSNVATVPIIQCRPGPVCTNIQNTTTNSSGAFSTTAHVYDDVGGGSCVAANNCWIEASDNLGKFDEQPISFASSPTTTTTPTGPCATPTIKGNANPNTLNGTSGPDVIAGLGGNDTINGNGGNDVICGGLGVDTITGGYGNDRLYGDGGNDKLDGGPGTTDKCYGGAGTDTGVNCEAKFTIP